MIYLSLVIVMTPDVDDLLLCSEKKDSIYLSSALGEECHKILKDKLPFCQNAVYYLGHDPSRRGKTFSSDRLKTTQICDRSLTK